MEILPLANSFTERLVTRVKLLRYTDLGLWYGMDGSIRKVRKTKLGPTKRNKNEEGRVSL